MNGGEEVLGRERRVSSESEVVSGRQASPERSNPPECD